MRGAYHFFIFLFSLSLKVMSFLGHSKAKKIIAGQKNWAKNLENILPQDRKVIWFHAASLGEFEQARPLIEHFRESRKNDFILLSFFSPSGYEVRKNYSSADYVFYLPLDTLQNARKIAGFRQIEMVIFVKYEFWFNLLHELKRNSIRTVLVSGIFRKDQHFFKWYGAWFRNQLKAFQHFFVQDQKSIKLLQSIGYNNCTLSGDTRFDRVVALNKSPFKSATLNSFCKGQKVLILGSSWEKEHELALRLKDEQPEWKLIIAPHEINQAKIEKLMQQFGSKSICWSKVKTDEDLSDYRLLLIDQIGLLSKLYRYATVALIGGGFGKGIHNLPEAAVYGVPVIFGPNYHSFKEAHDLIQSGGGFSIKNYTELSHLLHELSDQEKHQKAAKAAQTYVMSHSGATEKIFHQITES